MAAFTEAMVSTVLLLLWHHLVLLLPPEQQHSVCIRASHLRRLQLHPTAPGLPLPAARFLLCAGACPKSYGTNVARLAGLPASVVARAGTMSASREAIYAAGTAQQQQQKAGGCDAPDAAASAMDVDSGAGAGAGAGCDAELQQLVVSIRSCLKQLQDGSAAGGEGGPVQEQLVQLQQRAALLCK